MENAEKIRCTESFLKQKFEDSSFFASHPDAKAYRLEHTYRVANIGRRIARAEGFDETEMTIACLLHDISYCEEFGENGWIEHGRRAAQIARPLLEELEIPSDRIDDICFGIAIHVDDEAGFPGERTVFALSIGDADNIDRFDAYRIHETLQHDGFLEMPFEEKVKYIDNRLEKLGKMRDLPFGTETAQKLWDERITFYTAFLEKLLSQLKSSISLL